MGRDSARFIERHESSDVPRVGTLHEEPLAVVWSLRRFMQ